MRSIDRLGVPSLHRGKYKSLANKETQEVTSRVAKGSSLGVMLEAPGETASQTIPSPARQPLDEPTLQTLQTNQRGFFPCPPGKEGGNVPLRRSRSGSVRVEHCLSLVSAQFFS